MFRMIYIIMYVHVVDSPSLISISSSDGGGGGSEVERVMLFHDAVFCVCIYRQPLSASNTGSRTPLTDLLSQPPTPSLQYPIKSTVEDMEG